MGAQQGGAEFAGTERYRILRRLGAGGMGVVYAAHDRVLDEPVALKTLRNLDPHHLFRLKTEFRALAGVRHPNLVTLRELAAEGDHWFFTMDLVDGVDLLAWVRPRVRLVYGEGGEASAVAETIDASSGDPISGEAPSTPSSGPSSAREIDAGRLRAALVQLVEGLRALHARGMVHRDVKPSNVLVTPEGRVVVLDFGLVAAAARRGEHERQVVGTPHYMAPEQAAMSPVGPATDWYAVGAVLYEILTGRPPFTGRTSEILDVRQRGEPPPPSAVAAGVPEDLDALCVDLLRLDPAARLDGAAILARLGAAPARAAADRRPFVGREPELAALREAWDGVRAGGAASALVHGESGLGKTALVRRFLDGLDGAVVLAGRCYEREAVPFKAFDGVVDELSRHLGALDAGAAARLVPPDAAVLARLFPVLRRVRAFARSTEPPAGGRGTADDRGRAFAALRSLLDRLARERPVVVFVDDLQWADGDSLALLAEVLPARGAPPLLLVATARTEEQAERLAGRLPAPRRIPLLPLAEEEAARLVAAVLGDRAAPDVAAIVREAGGHPMFLRELAGSAAAGRGAAGPVRLDDLVRARVEGLPPPARRLLEVVAVAGAPLPLDVAAGAAGLAAPEAARGRDALRDLDLARPTGGAGDERIEPYHDRVREAVAGALAPADRASHHLRIADALEAAGGTADPRALVAHLEAAGEPERAAAHAERAAARAAEALAFEQAAALYGTALRLGRPDEAAARCLRFALGEALADAGRGPEAAEAFFAAAEGADPATRLDCHRRAAEYLLGSGHIERGLDALRAVLAEVGDRLPGTPRAALWSVVRRRLWLKVRGLAWTEREERAVDPRILTRLDTYRAVGVALGIVDHVRGADFQLRGLSLALRTGEPRRVCRALALESVYTGAQGVKAFPRARALLDEAGRIAARLDDPFLVAWVGLCEGMNDFFAGRFADARVRLGSAEEVLVRVASGTRWEISHSRVFRIGALRHMGAMRELGGWVEELLRDATRRGDRFSETTYSRAFNLVWLAQGDPERARHELARRTWTPPPGVYHNQEWHEMAARTELALYEGTAAAEAEDLDARFRRFEASLLPRVQASRVFARFLRGCLDLALADAAADPAPRLARADRLARSIGGEGCRYHLAFAGLVAGGASRRRGDDRAAADAYREAQAAADEHGMRLYAAAARWRLGERLGGADGARLVEDARAAMADAGVADPVRLLRVLAP